jgi:beta-phosphoglucomutase-like phosphatase (HAD superfamily)
VPQPPLLTLIDIDGTLLLDDALAHEGAMTEAMRRVYGVELPDHAVSGVVPWGKTDVRIAREVLARCGVDGPAFTSMLARWEACTGDLFRVYAAGSASRWRIRPGVRDALTALLADGLRLALLTGNLRSVAVTKMTCTGLLELLDLTASAFGDDEEIASCSPARAHASGRRSVAVAARPYRRGRRHTRGRRRRSRR